MMKALNFTLVVLFVLLLANIIVPFVIENYVEAGIFFVMLSAVNRFAQPVAFGLCIYALFRKPSKGFIILYSVYLVAAVLFFILLIRWYMTMDAMEPSGVEIG